MDPGATSAWCHALGTLVPALAGNITPAVLLITLAADGERWTVRVVVDSDDEATATAVADVRETLEATTGDAGLFRVHVERAIAPRAMQVPPWPEGLVYLRRGLLA